MQIVIEFLALSDPQKVFLRLTAKLEVQISALLLRRFVNETQDAK